MITVLTCNGWSAVYDANGNRVGEFHSLDIASKLADALKVVEQPITADPRFTDFPKQITPK